MEEKKQSGFGIAGLVIGILSILLSCGGLGVVPAIIGLILSVIGLVSKNRKKGIAIAGLVLCIFGIIIGLESASLASAIFGDDKSKDTGKKVESTKEATKDDEDKASEEEPSNEFKVGDVVETKNFKISFLDAKEYKDEYVKASDGNMYYRMEFEFENISDSDQAISSMMDWSCYADDYSASQAWVGNDTIDTTLSSGKKIKGSVYYEVPKDAKSIVLEYETNFFSQDKVKFIAK